MNEELYKQSIRRELGKFNTQKLELLMDECLGELKRRYLKDAQKYAQEIVK